MADAWAFLVTRTTYRNGRVRWVRVLCPGAAHCSWSPAKLAGEVALRSSQAVSPCWEPRRDLRRRVL